MSRKVVPVSRLVRYIKDRLEEDPVLDGVMIEGEISNLRIPNSGHWYFSLKDEKASLSCCMFRYQNSKVSFKPKNGDKVILTGDVSVYESMGSMQMVVGNMQPSGIGDLYLKLEALKKKLNEEGLFSINHKKQLKEYPMSIALVTGSNTAAREDMLITLQNRWPIAKVYEYPTPVQGNEAIPKIISSLQQADKGKHDVIILARGGGSLEDLWCFNDESLCRCIFDLHTPIVTGVGHETDTTLVDYVSDVRANTPTGAIEASTPDIYEVQALLDGYEIRLHNILTKSIQEYTVRLQYLSEKLYRYEDTIKLTRHNFNIFFQQFNKLLYSYSSNTKEQLKDIENTLTLLTHKQINQQKLKLTNIQNTLLTSIQNKTNTSKKDVEKMISLLDAYSPLKVLSRGYSVTYHNEKVIKSINEVNQEDKINILLSDGSLIAKVEEKENGRKEK